MDVVDVNAQTGQPRMDEADVPLVGKSRKSKKEGKKNKKRRGMWMWDFLLHKSGVR